MLGRYTAQITHPAASFGLLLLRIVAGAGIALHGVPKIQAPMNWAGDSFPPVLQALAALSEFGGGIAIVLGLFTPLAALGLVSTMAVATYQHAIVKGDPFVAGKGGGASYELAALYLGVFLFLLLAGPGKFSIDALLFKGKGSKGR